MWERVKAALIEFMLTDTVEWRNRMEYYEPNPGERMRLPLERFLEDELLNYRRNIQELALLRQEVIEASPLPSDGQPKGNQTSDPTESKVSRLMTSAVMLCLEKRLRSVAKVLDKYQHNPDMMRLIELRYIKGTHTGIGIQTELHISSKTYYRWRRELLENLATELGLK